MSIQYLDFLAAKQSIAVEGGFDIPLHGIDGRLFGFQKAIVRRAISAGKLCIWADCGLGKSWMALEWARHVSDHTVKPVLIVCPLAVARQFVGEGTKLDVTVEHSRDGVHSANVVVTNYEMLKHFTASDFGGVVIDESSCLKAFDSKTTTGIIEMFARTPYKLACSATPAPNDHMELGNHAEFMGVMSRAEMLAMFFTHDGASTSKWRLKGHARSRFWQWVSTWAIAVRTPADLGFDDSAYRLPKLTTHSHVIDTVLPAKDGQMFQLEATTLTEQRQVRRASLGDRVAAAAYFVNQSQEQWLVWCNLNDESKALAAAIPGAVEIVGADKPETKEQAIADFQAGTIRVLVSKPSIFGFGVNLQNCRNAVFVGLSHSFEAYYQAIRRIYRFGQTQPVNSHIVYHALEGAVIANVERKQRDFKDMTEQLVGYMTTDIDGSTTQRETSPYKRDLVAGEGWSMHLGDCVEVVSELSDESVDFSVFSPPFASLYTYSNSDRDMGNSSSVEEFQQHFQFLIAQLHRVIRSGRLVSVHCMNLPSSKQNDGVIGLKDFRGDIIRAFQAEGFIYHSEVCIWKNPVVAMQRTKAIGLLHKQLVKDSALSRQGIPDYLVTFRKDGANVNPVAGPLTEFVGENPPASSGDPVRDSIDMWQRYASPVWDDINPSDTLQHRSARENDDERHICLAKDSLVLTYHDGYKPIQDINVGRDLVLTHKGRWMPVIAKAKTSDAAETLSVNAAGVSGLVVTPNHKLWARDVGDAVHHLKERAKQTDPGWHEAQALNKGYLNLQCPPSDECSDFTDDELWMIGRFVADGHWHTGTSGRTSLHISVGDKKRDAFLSVAGDMAGTSHRASSGCVQYRIKDPHAKLRSSLADCGKYAHEKQFPPFVLRLGRVQAKHVLDGYLSGDGHFNQDRCRWNASSASKKLLLGLQLLILRVYGVTSTLHAGRGERQKTIKGRDVTCRQEWVLSFQSHGWGHSFVDDLGAWKKITKIQSAGIQETWNIQVLEDASYTAEGCIVKNCPLQLSVIRRALQLWTNPGDVVLSPFGGIGSEGYVSLEMDRQYIGVELKQSYWNCAVNNLRSLEHAGDQGQLFKDAS